MGFILGEVILKQVWMAAITSSGDLWFMGKGERGICICSGISYRCTGNLGT